MNKFMLSWLIPLATAMPVMVAFEAVAEEIVVPAAVEGSLAEGDRTLSDGSLSDTYNFEGSKGQIISLSLTSSDFDSYLVLLSESGEKLIENDDDFANEGTDAFLAVELPEDGTYEIIATTTAPDGSGEYSLFAQTGDAQLLTYQGLSFFLNGEPGKALPLFQRSFELQEATATLETKAELLVYIGSSYQRMSQYVEAMPYIEQAIALQRENGDKAAVGITTTVLGNLYESISDYRTALRFYQEALDVQRETSNSDGEITALNNIAGIYDSLDDYPLALETYEQALAIAQEISDRSSEGTILGNLGGVYSSQGNYVQALESYEKSIAIAQQTQDTLGIAANLINMGRAYNLLGSYALAISKLEEALAVSQTNSYSTYEATALDGLGLAYDYLGEYDRALDYYNQSLTVHRSTRNRRGETAALGNLGGVYATLEDYAQALTLYEEALAIAQEINVPTAISKNLLRIGGAYESLRQPDKAFGFYERSLAISRQIGDRASTGEALNSLGHHYQEANNPDKALELYGPALAIFKEINSRKGTAIALNNIAFSFYNKGEIEMATIFFKESVNNYESIRAELIELDTDLQTTYVDSVAYTYRQLADLLLQQGRVLEAQEVLELLKVQELEDYLDKRGRNASDGIGYQRPEAEILARYTALQETAIALERELAELNIRKTAGIITSEETSRQLELERLQGNLAEDFRDFSSVSEIRTYLDQLSGRSSQESTTSESETISNRDLIMNEAALLNILILEDRLELLVTTENAEVQQRTVEGVGKAQIDAAVTEFRRALQNPQMDARPIAQQFYTWLIAPIEEDLSAAGVQTIIYSPDESLRYIPLSALYDGEQWLAERLSVNNITARSLTNLSTLPSNNPSILAGAFSDSSIEHIVRGTGYTGLPYAGKEVTLLSDTLPGVTAFFDEDFSLGAIAPSAQGFNILHLATHASFVSTRPEESFILFGNGDTQTVEDISEWNLPNTDLVVLSACETGLGNFGDSGVQISGLGYQFQESGAKAVMSSLWRVDDGGTQRLINAFYQGLEQGLSKSEAMQQAQKLLIENDLKAVDEMISAGGRQAQTEQQAEQQAEQQTGALPERLDHPYYWAPFVLMGNGL